MPKINKQDKLDAIQTFNRMAADCKTVYTIVRHVSASGMQRRISAYIIVNGEPVCIDWYIQRVLGWRQHDKGGIVVNGCGMDMGFHLVYEFSGALGLKDSLTQRWL